MRSKYYFLMFFLLFVTNVLGATTCYNQEEKCLEPGGTRNINGIPVTLDCWRREVTYECREIADNSCKQLRDAGCSQISAKCRALSSGVCVVQDETYRCPVKTCDQSENIFCGKDLFCIGGDCAATNTVKAKDGEFGKAVTNLAVLNAAAEEMKKEAKGIDDLERAKKVKIFGGKAVECSHSIANAKNCCGSSGWLLKGCSDEEKELAKAKENGRVIEIGEYCYNKPLNLACTSYHKAYCVFDSRLARIIQNDGRRNQLGISFGDVGDEYAHLDCRGIIADELSHIDFSKIDFSELQAGFVEEAKKKIPKKEDFEKKAGSYTFEELKGKNARGKATVAPDQKVEHKALGRIQEFYDRTKK